MTTGELHGHPPRNIAQSDIPMVKAYFGPLPSSRVGYEFETDVEPTPYHPHIAKWVRGAPGVRDVDDDTVAIPVTVLKVMRTRATD